MALTLRIDDLKTQPFLGMKLDWQRNSVHVKQTPLIRKFLEQTNIAIPKALDSSVSPTISYKEGLESELQLEEEHTTYRRLIPILAYVVGKKRLDFCVPVSISGQHRKAT